MVCDKYFALIIKHGSPEKVLMNMNIYIYIDDLLTKLSISIECYRGFPSHVRGRGVPVGFPSHGPHGPHGRAANPWMKDPRAEC